MQQRKPPVLVVDFLHGGRRGVGAGVVILRPKGGAASELKPHIEELLRLQHAELDDGMKVWLPAEGTLVSDSSLKLANGLLPRQLNRVGRCLRTFRQADQDLVTERRPGAGSAGAVKCGFHHVHCLTELRQ